MLPRKHSTNQPSWHPSPDFIQQWNMGSGSQMVANRQASYPIPQLEPENGPNGQPSYPIPQLEPGNSPNGQLSYPVPQLEPRSSTQTVPNGQPIYPQNAPRQKTRTPRKRRIMIAILSVSLVVLVIGGILAATLLPNLLNPTNFGLAAPPTAEVSIDEQALNTLIMKNLNLPQNVISGLSVVPMPNNGLQINLNLNINASGIHRVMPIEVDSTFGGNSQQGLSLTIQHVKRDGTDAGPDIAANMQATLSQFLKQALPASGSSHPISLQQLAGSIKSSPSRVCGHGSILLHLGLQLALQGNHAIPVGVDGFIGMDQQHTLLFHLDRITHDGGADVDASVTAKARSIVDQVIGKAPALLDKEPMVQKIRLLSLRTQTVSVCGKNTVMLVLQLGAPQA